MPKPADRNRPWSPDDDLFLWHHQNEGTLWLATMLGRNKSQIRDRIFSLHHDPALRAALAKKPLAITPSLPCDPIEMDAWYVGLKAQRLAKLSMRAVKERT